MKIFEYKGEKFHSPAQICKLILRQGQWDFQNFIHFFFIFSIQMKSLEHKDK